MIVEWWMLVVALVATGIWIEYRAIRAYRQGYAKAFQEAQNNVSKSISEDFYFPVPLAVTLVYQNLIDKGLIRIVQHNGREEVHGHLDTRVGAEELSLTLIKEQFFRALKFEMEQRKWIRPNTKD